MALASISYRDKYGMKQTAAVVVTYNRKDLLEKCIGCLLGQQGASCDVIVVDNASTDGTAAMIRERFDLPSVRYENTGANLGGAGGFQYGVKRAVQLGYEYVWIMDDDTLPEETALSELFKADQVLNGKWGFLSSAAYWVDGSVCKANRQKKNEFTFVKDKDFEQKLIPIRFGSFVSLLVKSDVIKEVGLPIGEYFIWTDDYEFCGRISKRYPSYLVPTSRVIHAMKNHTKANAATDSLDRIDRYRCLFRNDVHCYRQFGSTGWMYILLKDIYMIVKVLLQAEDGKMYRIRTILQGFKEGLSFSPEIKTVDE